MGAKKIKFGYNKETDNVETLDLLPIIRNFLENISEPFETYLTKDDQLSELEFKSMSGFLAHGHNRGGMDLIVITDVMSLVASGAHMGLSVENKINKDYDEAWEDAKNEHPELSEDKQEDLEQLHNYVDELTSGEYNQIAWRVRVMYEGQGVLKIYAGYDFDAPYFRWNSAAQFEAIINFKTLTGLESKLNKLISKIEKTQ